MRKSSRKKEEFLEEFIGYLQSEPADFQEFVGRLLASLPGGDKGRYYTKIRVWKNTLIHRIIKRINTYRKKIINWHRWDEMDDKQRKAITFSIFNYYAGTIYYGRGIYYGG